MILKKIFFVTAILLLSLSAQAKDNFNVAWSHYTGWEPWGYAEESGILKKWADKYGITINVTLVNDYIESINLYTAGEFDATTMTNMDALTIPAVGGVDSTALIVGDFSNGNDGIVIKNGTSVADLKGRTVRLVELSVSHYMLARALDKNNLSESDLRIENTSDADIAALFVSDPNSAVVTWNPPLIQVRNAKGANLIFDSSQIEGEIIDLMVVKTDVDERFKKALTGAWYETLNQLSSRGKSAEEAIGFMAANSGGTPAEFKAQLKTTAMFYNPADAVSFVEGSQLKETMDLVRTFSFDKGLYGSSAENADFVGIQYPDGSVTGEKTNVQFRFDSTYMKLAAQGKL